MSSAVEAYRAAFIEQQVKDEQLFATGEYSRFIFPRHFIAFIIMWAALLIKYPSPRASKYGRMFAYVLVCYFSVYNILYVRTTGCGHGYGAGLVGIWAMLWGSNLLVFNDPERDFKRIEYRRVLVIEERTLPPIGRDGRIPGVKFKRVKGIAREYHWQSMPEDWSHRGWWIMDLCLGLRGVGWNYRPSAIPGPPAHVLADLEAKKKDGHIPLQDRPIYDRQCVRSFLNTTLNDILKNYIAIDIVKTLCLFDGYFTGDLSAPYPEAYNYYFGSFLGKIAANTSRLLLTCSAILFALKLGFHMTKLPLILIAHLFPGWATIPIDEPWLYPPLNAPLLESVAEGGLGGLWGRWWHQLFRVAFTVPSRWALHRLGRTPAKAILMATIAFVLSGVLHGAGSYTTLGPLRPFRGTFLFFFYQAPVIVLQSMWCKMVLPKMNVQFPEWVRRWGNYIFVACWIYYSSFLFADEVATGGLWFTEPVPFSYVQLILGGLPGESFWRWKGYKFFEIYRGEHWWDSGVVAL